MTQKPSDQMLESLSAMVDNEASEMELRRVLKGLDEGDGVFEQWHRYHLMGALMRQEGHVAASTSLVGSISAVLEGESMDDTPLVNGETVAESAKAGLQEDGWSKWKSFAGQSVVAASVAATFVLGFNYVGESNIDGAASAQVAATASPVQADPVSNNVPIGFDLPLPEARVVSKHFGAIPQQQGQRPQVVQYVDDLTDVATQELLNALLIEHSERASVNGSLGFMPFARVPKMSDTASTPNQ